MPGHARQIELTDEQVAELARVFLDRLESAVPTEDGCILWGGKKSERGYGHFGALRKSWLAHRVAYFIAYGEWPLPITRHLCNRPSCVRPDHIRAGTQRENYWDRVTDPSYSGTTHHRVS